MAITQGIVAIKASDVSWVDYFYPTVYTEQEALDAANNKFDALYETVAEAQADLATQTGDLIVRGIGEELVFTDFSGNENGFNLDVSPAMYSYTLEFGDTGSIGESGPFPDDGIVREYSVGVYSPVITLFTSNGESKIEKINYILVQETIDNLFSDKYLTNSVSYQFGASDIQGFGASEVFGENWVWVESKASISEVIVGGVRLKLAWDMYDDTQYIINPNDQYINNIYVDKEGNGDYEIPTKTILPEFTGEQRNFTLEHQETSIFTAPLVSYDELRSGFDIDVAIRDYNRETYVGLKENVDRDREIMFYYNSNKDKTTTTQQLCISSNMADFQLLGYESTFKVIDKLKLASSNSDETTETVFANASNWITRGAGYTVDRFTGASIVLDGSYIDGPDKYQNSAILTNTSYVIDNEEITNGCLLFWKTTASAPTDINNGTIVVTGHSSLGDWTLCYYNGLIPANVEFGTSSTLFDIRVFNSNITEEQMDDYANNLEYYLPRA